MDKNTQQTIGNDTPRFDIQKDGKNGSIGLQLQLHCIRTSTNRSNSGLDYSWHPTTRTFSTTQHASIVDQNILLHVPSYSTQKTMSNAHSQLFSNGLTTCAPKSSVTRASPSQYTMADGMEKNKYSTGQLELPYSNTSTKISTKHVGNYHSETHH
jgi:hypothetical protein